MLTAYEQQTSQLLQNPPAPTALYTTALLKGYINTARGQLAGEGQCIRAIGTIATVVGQRAYNFASINLGVAATTGIQGAIHVRRISIDIGLGQKWMTPRSWEWFDLYHLNNVVPQNDIPTDWSQYAQGAATPVGASAASGSFYLDPPPNDIYTLNCDCVCYPIPLVDDTTVEAIPYLWTDAVPFFAAYYALLSSQTSVRTRDAGEMLQYYNEFVGRARNAANPSVLTTMYQQSQDPAAAGKLGQRQQAGAA